MSRLVSLLSVTYLISMAAGQALAGNMMIMAPNDFGAQIEITGFNTGAQHAPGANVQFTDFSFKAPQSYVMPKIADYAATGRHVRDITFRVMSTDGFRVVSQWKLTDVTVTSFGVTNGALFPQPNQPNIFLPPETTFTLEFAKYEYTAYKPDGSAVVMCFNVKANTSC